MSSTWVPLTRQLSVRSPSNMFLRSCSTQSCLGDTHGHTERANTACSASRGRPTAPQVRRGTRVSSTFPPSWLPLDQPANPRGPPLRKRSTELARLKIWGEFHSQPVRSKPEVMTTSPSVHSWAAGKQPTTPGTPSTHDSRAVSSGSGSTASCS